MGRKIKGRKHHGVRDPEVQRAVREAKLKGKINSAPIDPDDQEIPRKLKVISEFMSNRSAPRKKVTNNIAPKKIKTVCKKKLLDSGPSVRKLDGELGRKPLRNVPRFQQKQGESQYHFFQRVDRKVTEVIKRQSYEKKFNVEVSEDPSTGKQIIASREKDEDELAKEEKRRKAIMKKKGIVIRTKEEKLELQRQRSKLRKLKKKGKLPPPKEELDSDVEDDDDDRLKDFSQLQDKVEFNEVVHAPPSITLKKNKLDVDLQDPEARRPASKDGLLVKAMFSGTQNGNRDSKKKNNSSNLSLAQKQILERERTRVIEQYRALKKLRNKKEH